MEKITEEEYIEIRQNEGKEAYFSLDTLKVVLLEKNEISSEEGPVSKYFDPQLREIFSYVLVRYILSGGAGFLINTAVLSLLYYVFHVYYITSSVVAYFISFFFSLFLHKFWTFNNPSMDNLHTQTWRYCLVSLLGLLINTALMALFVDVVHFYVISAQVISALITACCTFLISRNHVFNKNKI